MATKTNFRLTRCMDRGTIKDFAITDDGKRHLVQESSDGEKYFTIDNPYRSDSLKDRLFIGRIGDAIKSVIDGYADVLHGYTGLRFLSDHVCPVVMIDTKVGEEYRMKVIEGFKDTQIGYGIFCGNKNSFGGFHIIDEKGNIAIFRSTSPDIYDTEDAAKTKLNYYLDQAELIAKDSLVNNFHEDVPDIVREIAYDMIDDNDDILKLRDNLKELPNIGFDVRQIIK